LAGHATRADTRRAQDISKSAQRINGISASFVQPQQQWQDICTLQMFFAMHWLILFYKQ